METYDKTPNVKINRRPGTCRAIHTLGQLLKSLIGKAECNLLFVLRKKNTHLNTETLRERAVS